MTLPKNNHHTKFTDDEIEAVLDQLRFSEIIALMLYPEDKNEELREETKQKLNLQYIRKKRPLLIDAINQKLFKPSIISDMSSLLELSDERYIQDNRNNDKTTLHKVLASVRENMKTKNFSVFIQLMELINQEDGEASQRKAQEKLCDAARKNFVLESLGGSKYYSDNCKKYKPVSHFILAIYWTILFPGLLWRENIDKELVYEKLASYFDLVFPHILAPLSTAENKNKEISGTIITNEKSDIVLMFKYINFFKEKLLKLNNKRSTPKNLFKESDFSKPSQENPYFFNAEEIDKLEKEIPLIWKAMKEWLLTKK